MIKLGRNYELTIQVSEEGGDFLTIEPPFTLELDVTRNTSASASNCKLRIYNLDAGSRELINFNAYNLANYKSIVLKAGYGDNLAVIFTGNIQYAFSVREGVNFITQIECYDGGFAMVNGIVDITFPAGTKNSDAIATVMQYLPHVIPTAIGNFPGTINKDCTYSGNPSDILKELTGGAFFIDGLRAYALRNNEYASSIPVTVINASTGLLNTPTVEQTTARFEMLFEPTLNIGGLVQVDSSTNPSLNGFYTVTEVKHRGIISEVVSGDLITIGTFFYSKQLESIDDYLQSINQLQENSVSANGQ